MYVCVCVIDAGHPDLLDLRVGNDEWTLLSEAAASGHIDMTR